MNENGKGKAVASLVLGIISVFLMWNGFSGFIALILGIIGLAMAGGSKKQGYTGGIRKVGFVLSLISVIVAAVAVVSCVACGGLAVLESMSSGYYYY